MNVSNILFLNPSCFVKNLCSNCSCTPKFGEVSKENRRCMQNNSLTLLQDQVVQTDWYNCTRITPCPFVGFTLVHYGTIRCSFNFYNMPLIQYKGVNPYNAIKCGFYNYEKRFEIARVGLEKHFPFQQRYTVIF